MRKFPLVLAVLFAVPLFAQEQSVTYMPLVQSARFLDRVEFSVIKWIDAPAGAGVGPMLEATSVPCHTRRIAYARDFINNPAAQRVAVAKHLITQTVILSESVTGSGATLDTAATDAELFSAIAANWSAFSLCDVNGAD